MSDHNDFFDQSDGDRTVFVPRPSNRRNRPASNSSTAAPPVTPPLKHASVQPAVAINPAINQNVIRSAATGLITLGVHVRHMNHIADSEQFFQQICDDIKQLDAQLQQLGVSKEHIITTRYLLCTFIDEMVMSTPWGSQSIWAHKSLLMTFHNNALGGVKFFDIITLLLQNPAVNIDILELCYALISLGFEGQYRFKDGGRHELGKISDNLYQVISVNRPEVNKQLSIQIDGVKKQQTLLANNRFLWFSLVTCTAIILLGFTGYFYSINQHSDPVAIQASALGTHIEPLIRKPRISNLKQLSITLQQLLGNDIDNDLLAINESGNSVRITVTGKALFIPSSARINDKRRALLKRVADAIAPLDVAIQVVGHTDNVPIRTLQFPSNWELSTKRAESIAHFLQAQMPDKTITTEGRADLQPLVANDSRSNREANRRIEINLFTS